MTKHGLWRFHREARRARETYRDVPCRWWIDCEVERTYRMIDCMHSGRGRTAMYSNADAIVRCANRYARMYRLELTRAAHWNDLCQKIADRAGFNHHATLRSVLLHDAARKTSVLHWPRDRDEHSRPSVLGTSQEIYKRAARIAYIRAERERIAIDIGINAGEMIERWKVKKCAVCGSQSSGPSQYLPSYSKASDQVLDPIRESIGRQFYLCFKHRKEFKRLSEQAREIDSTRLNINRTKRKISESAKVSA